MQLKTLLGAALLLLAGATQAQTIPETTPEPEFIGEIVTVRPDGTVAKLEKQSVQMRTRANASAVIFGIGKAKTKLIIEGPKAGVRLTAGQPASFIVRAVDNATDPMSIINVFRFEAKKDKRMAEMASVSSFGSVKSNKLERLSFTGRKFGESSYLITLDETPANTVSRSPTRTTSTRNRLSYRPLRSTEPQPGLPTIYGSGLSAAVSFFAAHPARTCRSGDRLTRSPLVGSRLPK